MNNKERLVLPDDWPPNAFDKAYSCYSWLGAAKWRLAIVLGACYKTLSISWLLVMLHWRPYFDIKDLENQRKLSQGYLLNLNYTHQE